ncbi:hypothetical protein METBIDRAFT_229956 [Metschnikowia bicuspidata var. bicuspidata NRRL YB-4993]|uniref:Uncharacterized protein n=1 Tax=Metschnikowia bicuspidata var. bicuspidata NRRL YB-4993 TaxID=869754 RepID=A0A1A0H888_9ASCO|nr:hypothetical protein METBIDRAFT_229956 [Metschnikowia bicuspidata var. bicuspidata NRRL YB-4993]OBA20236.1 hypothetical protein METBIDRAFT_229956 [Metschnikowia bicuspidata var. bicuspidata NRRL YB-4993]
MSSNVAKSPTVNLTNQLANNRRIDRFYAPKSWRRNAWKYQITKPEGIISTHHMISIQYVIRRETDIQTGQPRFQYPLRRLEPPFDEVKTRKIRRNFSIEEALLSIKNDGVEYINVMGAIRKHNPSFADAILHDHSQMLKKNLAKAATKTFFRRAKPEKHIFVKLVDGAQRLSASTTSSMLALAKGFYQELYKLPDQMDEGEVDDFIRPLSKSITTIEKAELESPFTADELHRAL